jgi:hypothetical protein
MITIALPVNPVRLDAQPGGPRRCRQGLVHRPGGRAGRDHCAAGPGHLPEDDKRSAAAADTVTPPLPRTGSVRAGVADHVVTPEAPPDRFRLP